VRFRRVWLVFALAGLPGLAASSEYYVEPPLYRGELTVYPTSKRPRHRRVLPGEWMLISSQRGLWMPHVFDGYTTLVFRKRGPEVFVVKDGGQENIAGVRMGSLDGRIELRSAVRAGVSPLTIWCYASGVPEVPDLPPGRFYALAVQGASSLKPIARLRHLSALKVGCTPSVTSLAPLASLRDLESLWLSGANSPDLGPIGVLPKLKVLRLDCARQVADLSPLARLKELRVLEIDGSGKLTDLSPLARLPNLNVLVIRRCPALLDISCVGRLRNLTWFGLHGSPLVGDITALRHLANLRTVEIEGSPNLRDVSPLAKLSNLETISLQACENLIDISSLAALRTLTRIEIIDCPKVMDLWPLRRAAQDTQKFTVDWRLRGHLAAVQHASPTAVTLLMDGLYVSSVPMPPDALAEDDGWGNILSRSLVPDPAIGLRFGHLPYPAFRHKPGTILDFSLEGPRVFLNRDKGPRQLVGIIACSPLGSDALRSAVENGTSPLIIWTHTASIPSLPPLPPSRDYTLVLLDLRAPLDAVRHVNNITSLYLAYSSTATSTLAPLAHLTGMKSLVLKSTPAVQSLRHLARMRQLTTLDITLGPSVRNLAPLANLHNLTSLRLSCPRQVDFSPLARLPRLAELTLDVGAQCSDLSSLGKLKRLRMFALRCHAAPKDLDFLARLTNLEALRLVGVPNLTTLAPIATLRNAQVVILRSCARLRHIEPLLGLTGLRHLDMADCPRARDALTLEKLRRRGVGLALDHRLRAILPNPRLELTRIMGIQPPSP